MTTKEAFEKVINTRGIYKNLQVSPTTVKQLRINLKRGKVTIDRMEDILRRAGFRVVQEKLWNK